MSKYLILYKSDHAVDGPSVAEMFASAPPEQLQAGMALWQAWYQKCGGAIVDFGAPVDKTATLSGDSATTGRTPVTGYTVIQADSLDDAVSLMKDHPHFRAPGASVQVLECISMPGM